MTRTPCATTSSSRDRRTRTRTSPGPSSCAGTTTLFVALRCVDSLKTLMTPFLPFTSQRLHEMLGYEDVIAPQAGVREYEEEGGERHTVQGGEYEEVDRWCPSALPPGRALREPHPLFRKLDESVVEDELR